MRRTRFAPMRPVPYLDVSPLARLWDAGDLSLGRAVPVDGREYRVIDVEWAGAAKRRVHLEELVSGRQYMLVVDGGPHERSG